MHGCHLANNTLLIIAAVHFLSSSLCLHCELLGKNFNVIFLHVRYINNAERVVFINTHHLYPCILVVSLIFHSDDSSNMPDKNS